MGSDWRGLEGLEGIRVDGRGEDGRDGMGWNRFGVARIGAAESRVAGPRGGWVGTAGIEEVSQRKMLPLIPELALISMLILILMLALVLASVLVLILTSMLAVAEWWFMSREPGVVSHGPWRGHAWWNCAGWGLRRLTYKMLNAADCQATASRTNPLPAASPPPRCPPRSRSQSGSHSRSQSQLIRLCSG
jgi:hypothetical protein